MVARCNISSSAKWEVVKANAISVSFTNSQMAHGGSGLIDVYNADQKKVISSFGKLDKNTLYLFFVENVKGKDGDIAGYMPLQHQCGFIYDNPNPSIIAHELGHGAFNLRHTFSNERFIAAQGKTPNLMDYAGGTELWKHQWNEIQDPVGMWFAFLEEEDESEAEAIQESTSQDNLLLLLYELRLANIKNLANCDIAQWRKKSATNLATFKIKSLDTTLSNIYFTMIGDTSNIASWKINSLEKNIEDVQHPNGDAVAGAFVKYSFKQVETQTNALEIIVSITDTAVLNKYLYPSHPAENVLLGDPKVNPTVTISGTNPTYGFLGCVRFENNSTCNYPENYQENDKNKKHDGVDITAAVGENVYAIMGGVVQNVVSTFEPQNQLYSDNDKKDYRGLLSNQSTIQAYAYTNSNGIVENGSLSPNTNVGKCGCHYASGSYGNYVIVKVSLDKPIKDINGTTRSVIYMRYAHLNTVSVTNNQRINQGEVIGVAGCSGNAARIPQEQFHIHIEANSTNNWTGVRDIDVLDLLTTNITRP